MRSALLYIVAAACLALIISVAWWTREFVSPTPDPASVSVVYTAQEGDTVDSVAGSFRIPPSDLAAANDLTTTAAPLTPGEELTVPLAESSYFAVWGAHAAGIVAVIVGVLLSFWLGRLTGITPKIASRQILGISLVIGIVSYAADHAVGPNPPLTPQFIFTSLQVGFMWAAAFPMAARALGMRDPTAPVAQTPSGGAGTAQPMTPAEAPSVPPASESPSEASPNTPA